VKLIRTVQFHPALFHVLPIINVLSSRFVLQPGISVALPVSSFTLGPQQHPEIISITAAPVPTIYFRDHQVSVEELEHQLSAGGVKQRSLILKADRNTPYDLVMRITNLGLRQGFSVVLATAPVAQ
jgi:biopolymer transport protein ExbD